MRMGADLQAGGTHIKSQFHTWSLLFHLLLLSINNPNRALHDDLSQGDDNGVAAEGGGQSDIGLREPQGGKEVEGGTQGRESHSGIKGVGSGRIHERSIAVSKVARASIILKPISE